MTVASSEHEELAPEPVLPPAVLWDLDGTLVDTEPYWFSAERDLVDRYGDGDWPEHHAIAMVGFDLLDAAAYLQEHGRVDLPAREIVDRLLDGVIARLHRTIPWRPGARELLTELNAAGVPCVLVTMSWRRFVDPVLAALPRHSFVASIAGDEVPHGRGKPHPEPYLMGAAAAGAHPADCVAIEDSPTGVRSALDAGCRVVGVPNVKALGREPRLTIVESLDGLTPADLGAVLLAPVQRERERERRSPAPGIAGLTSRHVMVAIAVVASLLAVWFFARGGADEPEVVLPPGAVPVDVWVPYWTLADALPEAELRLTDVREVSPFWFGARGATSIVVDENANRVDAEGFLDAVPAQGRLVPSIRDEMPAGGMAAVLADPATRSQHVDTVVAFADDLDVAGIDLDYEQFAYADGSDTWATTRPNWVAFVGELAGSLHADGRTLTVSIPPVWGLPDDASPDTAIETASGYWVYDHGAIAPLVDAIRIMAYDYSVDEPGPIAPLWWVEDAIAGVGAVVPDEFHDKLVLGVGAYGRNWVISTVGDCPADAEGRTNVFARTVLDLADQRGGVAEYDATIGEWTFAYALAADSDTASCIQNRKVWWIDAEGVAARTELARRAGWGGVSLWALGYEDDEVWQALVSASRDPLLPADS